MRNGGSVKIFRLLLLAGCALAACGAHAARGVALEKYENVPAAGADGKPLSAEQVGKAVVAGAGAAKWGVSTHSAPNAVRLTYAQRKNTVVVDVTYAEGSYSIRYVDSHNLSYTDSGGAQTILATYNKWLKHLKAEIDKALKAP
jgi:hypothetical protein